MNIHGLRHSHASILLEQTKNYVYVKEQLGHHSVHFTMDHYGDVLKKKGKTRIIDVLDEAVI